MVESQPTYYRTMPYPKPATSNHEKNIHTAVSRRYFLRLVSISGLAALLPTRVFSAIHGDSASARSLSLYSPSTREHLDTVYWEKGRYIGEALNDINYIMRDRWTGEIKKIDTSLLDLLYSLARNLKVGRPFHIVCGYRSPETNARLRKHDKGVAKNSFHIQGKAIDIRLRGCELSVLKRKAVNLKAGGVGYYPQSKYLHIDVGPIRYW